MGWTSSTASWIFFFVYLRVPLAVLSPTYLEIPNSWIVELPLRPCAQFMQKLSVGPRRCRWKLRNFFMDFGSWTPRFGTVCWLNISPKMVRVATLTKSLKSPQEGTNSLNMLEVYMLNPTVGFKPVESIYDLHPTHPTTSGCWSWSTGWQFLPQHLLGLPRFKGWIFRILSFGVDKHVFGLKTSGFSIYSFRRTCITCAMDRPPPQATRILGKPYAAVKPWGALPWRYAPYPTGRRNPLGTKMDVNHKCWDFPL